MDGRNRNQALLSSLINRINSVERLPVSLPIRTIPPRRDDNEKCLICFEPWSEILSDVSQRQWNTNEECGHTICTNCYFTLTIVPGDDDDYDDDDIESQDFTTGHNVGKS